MTDQLLRIFTHDDVSESMRNHYFQLSGAKTLCMQPDVEHSIPSLLWLHILTPHVDVPRMYVLYMYITV